ncbi:helix-turn-helix domain-containing protein [Weissella tructae]|uniref:HTH cro/C1-type domain-containing protein n=2 Tax=Weissella TaxID=46255 RepID=A0A075TZ83_9LACO|nr:MULTISPECIES: helix-turn-helix transcriptional regulator [Weissella]AIG65565.1 hypothetical protein WS08_0626 [Weissella tructae]AIM62879.1 hypothetical protein WS74_0627 [Weissella ceti]AIM64277.1 hypothetical protein WS105_0687 [Weissella ceti]ELA06977.1 hypothetical protein WCNC_05337 [Weissella ceti NC36]QVV90697.1 helix-turn-helix domain-containing protein [Weissella tructae]
MELRDKVKWVIDSDITTYQFAKDTGLTNTVLSKLRRGEKEVGRLSLDVAEKIGGLYDSRN